MTCACAALVCDHRLPEFVSYDPENGKFTWLTGKLEWFNDIRKWRLWNICYAGKEVGRHLNCQGYLVVRIMRRECRAHRLAWFLTYGAWPQATDHINGDRTDNRLSNLRSVTVRENARNSGINKNNKSGVLGVYFSGGKWVAAIARKRIGTFVTKDEAVFARRTAEAALGFHPNHGRRPACDWENPRPRKALAGRPASLNASGGAS